MKNKTLSALLVCTAAFGACTPKTAPKRLEPYGPIIFLKNLEDDLNKEKENISNNVINHNDYQ